MASKVPEIVRFRLLIEVEAHQLGPVVAMLTHEGVTNLTHELITDVPAFARRQVHEVKAEDFLAEWLKDHPTFRARDAMKHFEAHGRNKTSVYSVLSTLVEKKILNKLDAGYYQRADVKAIAAPKKGEASKKITREHHEIDHKEFILQYAREHQGRISTAKLRAHFEEHGRKVKSVSGALTVLIKKKMIKSLGRGEYALTAKGGAKTEPPKEAPPKIANGHANGVQLAFDEAVTHG